MLIILVRVGILHLYNLLCVLLSELILLQEFSCETLATLRLIFRRTTDEGNLRRLRCII